MGRRISSGLLLLFLCLLYADSALAADGIAIHGRVLLPDKTPAPGVRVTLQRSPDPLETAKSQIAGQAAEPVQTVVTRPEGDFLIQAPQTGMWVLSVEAGGYVPMDANQPGITTLCALSGS
jgi:hypothetical protein